MRESEKDKFGLYLLGLIISSTVVIEAMKILSELTLSIFNFS